VPFKICRDHSNEKNTYAVGESRWYPGLLTLMCIKPHKHTTDLFLLGSFDVETAKALRDQLNTWIQSEESHSDSSEDGARID